jgi:hypothetical protein
MSKSTAKRNRKPKTAAEVVPTPEAIAEFGYIRALIRARNAAGFVSPNKGKVRLTKKEQRLADAHLPDFVTA